MGSKKWTDTEVNKILDFLADNRHFEKPTAQLYYKRFLDESKVDATWEVVKYKVRYLKNCFEKAESWRNNTGAGLLAEDNENGINTVNDKMRKMCRYYDRLKDILADKRPCELDMIDSELSPEFLGFMDTEELEKELNNSIPGIATSSETQVAMVEEQRTENEIESTLPNPSKQAKVAAFAERLKKSATKDSMSQLAKFQAERNETQRLRIQFEEDKFKKEFEFQKEKFKVELELKKHELDLKKIEIEKHEKIKILELEKNERVAKFELEKNERVAKYELDLKYKTK